MWCMLLRNFVWLHPALQNITRSRDLETQLLSYSCSTSGSSPWRHNAVVLAHWRYKKCPTWHLCFLIHPRSREQINSDTVRISPSRTHLLPRSAFGALRRGCKLIHSLFHVISKESCGVAVFSWCVSITPSKTNAHDVWTKVFYDGWKWKHYRFCPKGPKINEKQKFLVGALNSFAHVAVSWSKWPHWLLFIQNVYTVT